ncbi:MAG: hypothetical protein AAGD01_17395 [Acidobacteriota bacterium]
MLNEMYPFRWTLHIILLWTVLATVSGLPASAAAAEGECPAAVPLESNPWTRSFETQSSTQLIAFDLPSAGVFAVEALPQLGAPVAIDLRSASPRCATPLALTSSLERSAHRWTLAVHHPGIHVIQVASRAPQQALGSYRLAAYFAPLTPSTEAFWAPAEATGEQWVEALWTRFHDEDGKLRVESLAIRPLETDPAKRNRVASLESAILESDSSSSNASSSATSGWLQASWFAEPASRLEASHSVAGSEPSAPGSAHLAAWIELHHGEAGSLYDPTDIEIVNPNPGASRVDFAGFGEIARRGASGTLHGNTDIEIVNPNPGASRVDFGAFGEITRRGASGALYGNTDIEIVNPNPGASRVDFPGDSEMARLGASGALHGNTDIEIVNPNPGASRAPRLVRSAFGRSFPVQLALSSQSGRRPNRELLVRNVLSAAANHLHRVHQGPQQASTVRGLAPCSANDEGDPLASFACARRIQLQQIIDGELFHPEGADDDLYTFAVDSLAGIEILALGEIDFSGELYDSAGRRLQGTRSASSELYLADTLEPGRYYLRIGAKDGEMGSYRLKVRNRQ